MLDMSQSLGSLTAWLSQHAVLLVVTAVVLFVVYRWARPAIHRLLVRVLETQAKTLDGDASAVADVEKRVTTIEDLLVKALRFFVMAAIVSLILGLLNLWSLVAGLGIVFAAITLAGQSIVLDYLMGVLILAEGQYYKGDVVRIGAVEGNAEEVGLRRTLIRDVRGTLHSVSNGDVRASANMTRSYAVAMVNIEGIADRDIEGARLVLEAVAAEMAADPQLADLFLEPPRYVGTVSLTAAGSTLRVSARVRPESRIQVEMEMRRRISAGLSAQGIEPIRPVAAATRA
jgi:moderate conductance mechanosensitive channel